MKVLRNFFRLCFHLIIKRDILSVFAKRKYGKIGKNTWIFKPIYKDKNEHLISIGSNTVIGHDTRMQLYTDKVAVTPHIIIGDNCYFGSYNSFLAGGNITIGNGVLMASNILITSENHSTNPESNEYYMDQPLICADVTIDEGCWIGEKVCILPGVHIGKKSIIGAGSVVTKSIPDYSIAVGNPAKVIKLYNMETHKWVKVDA